MGVKNGTWMGFAIEESSVSGKWDLSLSMQAENQYIPGVCNIGRSEIKRRKLAGWIGLAITVILYIILVYLAVPRLFRLVLFIPSTAAAIGFLQARMHFCAYFGMMGLFNFGEVGKIETVGLEEFHAIDRRKALRIIIYSTIIGIAVAILAYYLP